MMKQGQPTDDGENRLLSTRRRFLLAGALAGAGAMGLADALDEDGELGSLWAGMAALSQAYNVAGNLWVGPDSAKADVDAESGRIYMATDIQRDYYGDGGSWVEYGYGTAANPGPPVYADAVTTEQLNNVRHASAFSGADGGAKIQAAINDLPVEGGTVYIGPEGPDTGNKWIWSSPISVPSDTHIMGAGMGATTMKQANGADAVGFHIQDDAKNVTITDLEMNGNRRNQSLDTSANHVQLILCNAGGENIAIERIYGHDAVNSVFNTELDESNRHKHISVKNCFIDQNYDPAVDDPSTEHKPAEDGVEFKTTDFVTVSGCVFTGIWRHSIELERSKHASVTNNLFYKTAYDEPAVMAQTADVNSQIKAENVVIANNVFKNLKGGGGIAFSGGQRIVVIGNVLEELDDVAITGATANGVTPSDLVIAHNLINNAGETTQVGISLSGFDNAQVRGNMIVGGDRGIVLNSQTHGEVIANYISGPDRMGVHLTGTGADNRVINNLVEDNTSTPAYLSQSDERLYLAGNKAYNPPSFGIEIQGGSEHTVFANVLQSGAAYGIALTTSATDSYVVSNVFLNNNNAIRFKSTADNNLAKNNFGVVTVLDEGVGNEIKFNDGYVTEATGSASVSDTGTIAHGLDETPTYVNLTTSADKHIAVVTAVDGTNITVGLHDDTGSAVTANETVYWEAKAR